MCDIAYVIRYHLAAIFQLMNVEIPEYNIQLQTTKCLSTAVIMLYMFAGKEALMKTEYCDVPNVQARVRDKMKHNELVFKELKGCLMEPPSLTLPRMLFYVMLTNGDLQLSTDLTKTKMFPGHVFVLERHHGGERFSMYQSYIGHYDLNKQIDMMKSLSLSRSRMARLIDSLGRVTNTKVWDDDTTKDWKSVSLVDEGRFLQHNVLGNILLCFQTVTTNTCVQHLKELIDQAIPKIQAHLGNANSDPLRIYDGGKTINMKEPMMEPLTYKQMLAELLCLKDKL